MRCKHQPLTSDITEVLAEFGFWILVIAGLWMIWSP